MHQKVDERRRGDADRLHEDVPHGPRRRQAEPRASPASSRNGSTRATARSSRRRARRSSRRPSPLTAARSPRSPASIVVGKDGTPWRVGFALLNEFSDHVIERQNYLWLAHSKLRPCVVRTGAAARRPARPMSAARRASAAARRSSSSSRSSPARPTCRTRSPISRRITSSTPGSAGRATSTSIPSARRRCPFAAGIKTKAGDVFEIEAPGFRAAAGQSACDRQERESAVNRRL